ITILFPAVRLKTGRSTKMRVHQTELFSTFIHDFSESVLSLTHVFSQRHRGIISTVHQCGLEQFVHSELLSRLQPDSVAKSGSRTTDAGTGRIYRLFINGDQFIQIFHPLHGYGRSKKLSQRGYLPLLISIPGIQYFSRISIHYDRRMSTDNIQLRRERFEFRLKTGRETTAFSHYRRGFFFQRRFFKAIISALEKTEDTFAFSCQQARLIENRKSCDRESSDEDKKFSHISLYFFLCFLLGFLFLAVLHP